MLADLGERLRDAVAHVISTAVADAVRSVASTLLGDASEHFQTPHGASWSRDTSSGLWHEPDDARRERTFGGFYPEDHEDPLDDERTPEPTKPSRIRNALALGFEGAAWWMRRGVGGCYAASAVGVGLGCAAIGYLVGDRLTGSVLGLASLAGVVRSGTALLTRIGMP